MNATVLVNGEPRDTVSVNDRGLQYGDGLFETIAVHAGRPLLLDRHLARLRRGAERLAIALPSTDLLTGEAANLCAEAQRAVLKIIVTRGCGGRGYACDAQAQPTRILKLSAWPERPAECARDGVAVRLCRTRLARNPRLAGIKHLNRLEQVLARAEWRDEYAEGLMSDDSGALIEGTMSNVFLVMDGVLATPALADCGVEGVMRAVVLDAAEALGIAARVGRVAMEDFGNAQEVFLTNSLIGIWPVRGLDRSAIGQDGLELPVGPVTRRLQEAIAGE